MTRSRRILDRLARGLTRLLLHVFFRTTEVQGVAHVPPSGPVLFVANHGNGLVDPMVMVAVLPRMPRFLAKHTLWSNPAVRPLLELAGAVPVYRAQEGDTLRNRETFVRCFEELASGGAVGLFPEGVSHDRPELLPLKTGAARIALGAREHGAEPVAIVPVGLTFERKEMFRSRLLVSVGEPIRATDDTGARELTDRIDAGLREVTLNVDSWRTSQLVERAAEIYGAEAERALPGRAKLAERFSLRHQFGAGYEQARAADPERIAALEAMADRYERILEALHLRDDHVTSDYPWSHVRVYVADRVPVLIAQLPFALVGFLLDYLPYRLPGFVARRVEHEADQPATYKLLTGLVMFPLFWAIEIAIAGHFWRTPGALAMAAIAPVTGWIALRFYERNQSFWSEARAYLTMRVAKDRAAELRALRRMMREELARLVDESDPDAPDRLVGA
jgi:1-acyl-sn-glycerol-3-phosphate acyltransferase